MSGEITGIQDCLRQLDEAMPEGLILNQEGAGFGDEGPITRLWGVRRGHRSVFLVGRRGLPVYRLSCLGGFVSISPCGN